MTYLYSNMDHCRRPGIMEKDWRPHMAGFVGKTNRSIMEIKAVNINLERTEWRIRE